MRIAQISPMIERIPPKTYGGTERVIYYLVEELIKKGHEVTLFASGDSATSGKLFPVYPIGLRQARIKNMYGPNPHVMQGIGLAYQNQEKFDIIHDHTGYFGLPTANVSKTPSVFTMHGPLNLLNKRIFQSLRRPYLVTISKKQAESAPNLNIVDTIYNGLDMSKYPFSEKNEGYLLFVGRISAEKGVHHAVQAAIHLNLPLIIAAKLDNVDMNYFRKHIKPYLSEKIRWIGEVNEKERNKLMSKALCFLHPVTWREPFGLTLIEAMACGCPVIAFNKGSIPEIIEDGKTGFVVKNLDEMIKAISKISKIKRKDCRNHALQNFNSKKMADKYEEIYIKILSRESSYAHRTRITEHMRTSFRSDSNISY